MSESAPKGPEAAVTAASDALLKLVGSGKNLWANEHADEYVRRLREYWEPTPRTSTMSLRI